jgi:chromosome segregation ATPase
MEPADLYGLPLERFTEERNALARQLRQAGRRDEGESVARLRKPSLAAWAVNQLVRTQRRELDALFRAGDELQKTQADLMAHRGEPQALRQAVDDERAAVRLLTDRARGLLSSEGHELTPARLEQVSESLHAAALDREARARVRDGCLTRELRHIGLGDLAAAAGASKRTRSTAPPVRAKRDPRAEAEARKTRSEARKVEAQARRKMERAAREVRTAEERRDRAADGLREAEQALTAVRQAADEAAQQYERVRRRLETSS